MNIQFYSRPSYPYPGPTLPSAANGYALPPLPALNDSYVGGGYGGGAQGMIAGQYMDLEQRIQLAQAKMQQARMQQGRLDAGANVANAGDQNLIELSERGVLNKEEFIAASATQNEIQRLLGKFKADGTITPQEQAQLLQMRARLKQQLAQFSAGDYHPQARPDNVQDRQSAALYDLMSQGKISQAQATQLRAQMALAAQQEGGEEAQGFDPEDQASANLDRQEALDQQLEKAAHLRAKNRFKLPELHNEVNPEMTQPYTGQ